MKIETVFDYFWWLNFSLKWQHVTLRLAVFRRQRFWRTYAVLRHFYRGHAFQRWSLGRKGLRQIDNWRQYKQPAKQYIYLFTNDADYYESKTKEPSLQNVLVDRSTDRFQRYRAHWFLDQRPQFIPFRRGRRTRSAEVTVGVR